MIRTTQPVIYDQRSPEKEAVVYAEVYSVIRNTREKSYTILIEEFIKIDYEQEIEGEIQVFQAKQVIYQRPPKIMSYAESNALTDYLDSAFQITETKTERRDRYTVLGHLIVNNQDMVYGSTWELV